MHRVIAYLLMVIGLALICFAFTGVYQTFVNKKPVAQLVAAQPLSITVQGTPLQMESPAMIQTVNTFLFAFFMIFLAFLGTNFVGLGIKMLRTERICDTLQKLRKEDVLANEKDIKKL